MFWPDVVALKEFYASALGKLACNAVRHHIRMFWRDSKDEVVLGLGFAPPYLLPFLQDAQRVIACMPAQQGVIHWPPQARNLTLLSDEAELPLPDNSVHRVLIVHAIENSEHIRTMLEEVWRVLAPAGRVLIIAPNRRGIWARAPGSPFAYGQPFTASQLKELVSEHSFTPLKCVTALFFPPSTRRFLLRCAGFLEKFGSHFFPAFGGLVILEAEKRIYAPIAQKSYRAARKSYIPVVQPAAGIGI